MVNFEAEKNNKKIVSLSTIEAYLNTKDIKNKIESERYGVKSFENNVEKYLPRTKEQFAGDLWVMDGTPVQFYCWNGKTGKEKKQIRLNLFVMIDAFSGKIVGFDISLSEDRFNVLNTLKMAFKIHGHLPAEILHDNFSANKTEEVKKIKSDLEKMGVMFRPAKVGNAKDKTHVERFFGTLQSTVMRLYDDYVGEGITSKRKNGRPDQAYIKKAMKRTEVTMDVMKFRIANQIEQYNHVATTKKTTPSQRFEVSPKPNTVSLMAEQIPFLFWYRKSIKIRNSMVIMTVKDVKYHYDIKSYELMSQLNGSSVDVFYDETDLGSVQLFEPESDRFICECNLIIGPKASNIGRTEKSKNKILAHHQSKKGFNKYFEVSR